ncbi:hypothetical protein [Mongoliitalea lutea]|uniref:Uncharacterized protein n=1 Tax=Mongoliitalea lutea TaxID=849756 RepID=A0A8J3G5I5_9BACT|nr:hypothetical protein [Mongoliitalea lutea]GHB36274.1 hypothetical protein GCM10008106_16950 [Mongoliitalea lutea]
MKKLIFIGLFFFVIGFINAQTDPIQEIKSKAIQIDSLKRQIILEQNNSKGIQSSLLQLRERYRVRGDSLNLLNGRLQEFEKTKNSQRSIETQLKLKSDSIGLLKSELRTAKNEIISEKNKGITLAKQEKEAGKIELLDKISQKYANTSFDDLIRITTKYSVEKDFQIVSKTSEVAGQLEKLIIYHKAENLLHEKFDKSKVNLELKNLDVISEESQLTNQLRKKIQDYEIVNQGLKNALAKINQIDQSELVRGMPTEIQNTKLGKILTELSSFTFNYDLKENNYPYLIEITLEVMRRKHPNPDADITDLLLKL